MVLTTLFTALALLQTPAAPIVPRIQFAPATPTLEYRLAVPAQEAKKVSLHAQNSTLKDVLGKLPKVDYVVDADTFKDRRISLNLTDVSLTSALNAIAAALDAHWETVGGVRVLKKGAGGTFEFRNLETRPFTTPDRVYTLPLVPKFDAPNLKLFSARPGMDVDALLKSITAQQKELAKKQGYLKVSDLTPTQRKLAGIAEGGGTISIVITRDGETLTIKGE